MNQQQYILYQMAIAGFYCREIQFRADNQVIISTEGELTGKLVRFYNSIKHLVNTFSKSPDAKDSYKQTIKLTLKETFDHPAIVEGQHQTFTELKVAG